jgi:Glycosyltransferase family 87
MKTATRAGQAALATLFLCAATVAYTHHMPDFARFRAGIDDFLLRYAEARAVGTGHMYDIEAGYREQDRVVGTHIIGAFPDRLPWQALLMAPLARLPYRWAHWFWVGLDLAAFAALVLVWLLPHDLVLWGATFFPVAASIIQGQDGILLALALAGVLRLAASRRDTAAGLLLALCTAKPHLFLLVPLALIAHRRWRIVSSAALGTVGLLILGTAAAGRDWPERLWSIIKAATGPAKVYAMPPPNLFQFGVSAVTIACAVALAAAFGIMVWRIRSLDMGVAAAVVASFLISPHTAIYDLPLLLVAFPLLPLPSFAGWIRYTLLTPLPYWAVLWGMPWSFALPLMLLAVTLCAWFAQDRGRNAFEGRLRLRASSDSQAAIFASQD